LQILSFATVLVREKYALELNRKGDSEEAGWVLLTLH
jgi:hypothetical protein